MTEKRDPERGANLDPAVVEGFGQEWQRFDHLEFAEHDAAELFDGYFAIFPWHALPAGAVGIDAGCGSGRWARRVAPRVGTLHCVDASAGALAVAARALAEQTNCVLHQATVDNMPLADASADFGYSLGVLHHIPDTLSALQACTSKLKPGAPFLLYLYYAFDNRPAWFRVLWRGSDLLRRVVARLPFRLRSALAEMLAVFVYWPLARLARVAASMGAGVDTFPLSAYRDRSFYVMRTDALDRFGTRLEQRFTRAQIEAMMRAARLGRVVFSEQSPYWVALGWKEPA